MALFRRTAAPTIDAEAIAAQVIEVVKANMPATVVVPLPREDFGEANPFSPGRPFVPVGIDPRDPITDRPEPRRNEFDVSINLRVTQARFIPFSVLRDTAEKVDIIRRCIEARKAQMLGLDWDITLSRQAVKRIMISTGETSPGKAAQMARQKFEPEMVRLREWWEKPDRFNGMDFSTWLSTLLEEQLVIDAVTIWPRRKLSGEVVAFELLDGATIKPLLDHRGSTPTPPNPAYQQVLYGFPRGEFTASNDDESPAYRLDQLVYRPRSRRTWSPYGFSNVDYALEKADIYLKRSNWIRGEFTDGAVPDTWMIPPADSKMKPDQLLEWETAMNAVLAGQPNERRKLKLTPPGFTADRMANFTDLYKPDLDEFLVKILCACFDVMPTEIGFPPGSGIGGKGHQEGEANSSQRKAVRPTAVWVEGLLTDLMRTYLGCPPELQFTLIGYQIEDQESAEKVTDSETKSGRATINEGRAARGLTLWEFEEADTPFVVTGSGLVFLKGAIAAQAAIEPPKPVHEAETVPAAEPTSATDPRPAAEEVPEDGDPINADAPVPDGFIRVAGHIRRKQGSAAAVIGEAAKFVAFARKRAGATWRNFTFEHVDEQFARQMNVAGSAGDMELVKQLAADVGKVRARTVSRATKDRLKAEHGPKVARSLNAVLPAAGPLVAGWLARDAATKSTEVAQHAAEGFVREQLDTDSYDDLDGDIEEFVTAGHQAGWDAAWLGEEEDDEEEDTGDDEDKPGRLRSLINGVPGLRDALIVATVGLVADALLTDSPAEKVSQVLDEMPMVDSFTDVELTATLTAGSLDSAEKQGIGYVQLVAGAGECDFCQGYDGRIMTLDNDSGMPPLHNGCQCDVEPLD